MSHLFSPSALAGFYQASLQLPETIAALGCLNAVVRRTQPQEERAQSWDEALAATRDAGTIFDGPRISAVLEEWKRRQNHDGADEVVTRAAEGLGAQSIGMTVLEPARFITSLRNFCRGLPANAEAVEGFHRLDPDAVILRNPFWRSSDSRSLNSLRLAANALHEAVHIVGPRDPLASEVCAFAYDTAFRVSYGDDGFYETIMGLAPKSARTFEAGLFLYLQNSYR